MGPNYNGDTVDEINYILNHKQGVVQDVQDAIWIVMTGQSGDTPSATAQAMVTAAQANPGYVPSALGVMAVYYSMGGTTLPANSTAAASQFQSLFFEVPVPAVSQQQGCSGCVSSITLPSGDVTNSALVLNRNAATQASTSAEYFSLTLTNVGSGFSIANQAYNAWCLGWYNSSLDTAGTPGAPVISTYSSSFPSAIVPLSGHTINEINYILNNKSGTVQDVQDAIWLVMTGFTGDTPSTTAQNLAAAAEMNPNYCPPTGGIIGIVYEIGASGLPNNSTTAASQFQNVIFETICNSTQRRRRPESTRAFPVAEEDGGHVPNAILSKKSPTPTLLPTRAT